MHFEATYHGLHKWFQHTFETFGWMLLAHEEGDHEYKVKAYLKSVAHLKKSLEEKHKTIECPDKKTDLAIMLKKLKVLEAHANKTFKK